VRLGLLSGVALVIALSAVAGVFAAHAVSGQAAASPPTPSELVAVLNQTEQSTGMLRVSACKPVSATNEQCANPAPAIAKVTFATYPSLAALYTKYTEIIRNLTAGKSLAGVENKGRCGAVAPKPTAETAWNRSDAYSTKYSVKQMALGNVPAETATGRVFCGQVANGSAVFVWTQDSGDLLGYATGSDASHMDVWQWFDEVHHHIVIPGQTGTS
jgi:hypothetical protein